MEETASKRFKGYGDQANHIPNGRQPRQHPVLSRYYKQVFTLREYILSRISTKSRARRKKITDVGTAQQKVGAEPDKSFGEVHYRPERESDLAKLLDSTLVGVTKEADPEAEEARIKDLVSFTQTQSRSSASGSSGRSSTTQAELIDFAICTLFQKIYRRVSKPQHLLCHGYQRSGGGGQANQPLAAAGGGIQGITSQYPNSLVTTLRGGLWSDVLSLMGKQGDRIMLDLLLECGLFASVHAGRDNLYQLSGKN